MASQEDEGDLLQLFLSLKTDEPIQHLDNISRDPDKLQWRYCIIGKPLMGKKANQNAFCRVMLGVWNWRKGVDIDPIEDDRFRIRFQHKMDYQKLVEEGP